MNYKTIHSLLISLRPRQWSKNLFLFAGIIFSQQISEQSLFLKVFYAFFLFCLLTGGTYLINDVIDRESDAKNPLKSKRPVANGQLSVKTALTSAILLLALSISLSFICDTSLGFIALLYLAVQILYSFWLKKIVILDAFTVVFSYLLRVSAGALLVKVAISPWLLTCSILLSLFLIVCKRRHELEYLGNNAQYFRETLGEYNTALLDQMVSVVSSATIISYCFYTMSEKTIMQTHTENLKFTIPCVIYGVFRYLYLVYRKNQGSYPEDMILKDKPLLLDILLWVGLMICFLYF